MYIDTYIMYYIHHIHIHIDIYTFIMYYKFERDDPAWEDYTHLNPDMNNLIEFKNTVLNLINGEINSISVSKDAKVKLFVQKVVSLDLNMHEYEVRLLDLVFFRSSSTLPVL